MYRQSTFQECQRRDLVTVLMRLGDQAERRRLAATFSISVSVCARSVMR